MVCSEALQRACHRSDLRPTSPVMAFVSRVCCLSSTHLEERAWVIYDVMKRQRQGNVGFFRLCLSHENSGRFFRPALVMIPLNFCIVIGTAWSAAIFVHMRGTLYDFVPRMYCYRFCSIVDLIPSPSAPSHRPHPVNCRTRHDE